MPEKKDLIKITDFIWEIPKSFRSDMRVPARVFASKRMLEDIIRDKSLDQLVNVATLPGIKKAAIAMPDIHEGYGFPIGGVAAMEYPDGIISPGGIGYDINCGVRLLISSLTYKDIENRYGIIAKKLSQNIPSGVGRGGVIKLSKSELDKVLKYGIKWAFDNGYAEKNDISHIESLGTLKEANPEAVSVHAKSRGHDQLGTIGAGNHFIEVDVVYETYDEKTAKIFGFQKDKIVVLIHTGSRGLGHQVATDYIRTMLTSISKYNITLPDRELACAPFSSEEGTAYFGAMSAAANFAWTNRQIITWEVRNVWKEIFGEENLLLFYDVAHNIAKIEEYEINGNQQKVIMHRKGATRAFPPFHKEIPDEYKEVGQPVLIPGSMGTASYVLVGTERGVKESFSSSCHGAGRMMSRHGAKKIIGGKELLMQLAKEHITVRTGSIRDLPEEAPYAYKDIHEVVDIVDKAGIAKKVAMLKPVVVIKG